MGAKKAKPVPQGIGSEVFFHPPLAELCKAMGAKWDKSDGKCTLPNGGSISVQEVDITHVGDFMSVVTDVLMSKDFNTEYNTARRNSKKKREQWAEDTAFDLYRSGADVNVFMITQIKQT